MCLLSCNFDVHVQTQKISIDHAKNLFFFVPVNLKFYYALSHVVIFATYDNTFSVDYRNLLEQKNYNYILVRFFVSECITGKSTMIIKEHTTHLEEKFIEKRSVFANTPLHKCLFIKLNVLEDNCSKFSSPPPTTLFFLFLCISFYMKIYLCSWTAVIKYIWQWWHWTRTSENTIMLIISTQVKNESWLSLIIHATKTALQ